MKMVMAIVNRDDAYVVVHNLTKQGYKVTKLATVGGFLKVGNMTILMGVEDDKVDEVVSIIDRYSKSRKQIMPNSADLGIGGVYAGMPVEVTVGGASIFIWSVDRFERV